MTPFEISLPKNDLDQAADRCQNLRSPYRSHPRHELSVRLVGLKETEAGAAIAPHANETRKR